MQAHEIAHVLLVPVVTIDLTCIRQSRHTHAAGMQFQFFHSVAIMCTVLIWIAVSGIIR